MVRQVDMKAWLDDFLGELHRTRLKPLCFKKVRRTFSRDRGQYWERFNFQGSAANCPGAEDWRFYINVGVEFKNVPLRRDWSYFAQTHWAARLESVIPAAPSVWKYNEWTDEAEMAEKLETFMLEASAKIAAHLDGIHAHYLKNDYLKSYRFD